LEKEARKLGVKFYPNKYFSNIPDPIRIFKAMREIKKVVKDFKPDLVSSHSTVAGFLGRLTIRNKIPTIFTAHGWAFAKGTPFLRKYLVILVEKIVGRFCSKIICVSNFDKNLALKYKIVPKEKLMAIHNGVEIEKVKSQKSKIKSLENKIRIVFVGRLSQQKDPLLLLKSFSSLFSGLKDKVEVSIVGEGKKRKKLEKFIKENKLGERVKLLGSISREKVFEILEKSDIFILTSNWEGFPRSILEAMSCGLAIIASDVGGIKEAVDESCGILVKRGDKEELKDTLEKLIENPSLIKKMGKNAKERSKNEFSLDKMLRETEDIYNKVILS
jgi:glycosyltransferase involved in cell wall biosynthesis